MTGKKNHARCFLTRDQHRDPQFWPPALLLLTLAAACGTPATVLDKADAQVADAGALADAQRVDQGSADQQVAADAAAYDQGGQFVDATAGDTGGDAGAQADSAVAADHPLAFDSAQVSTDAGSVDSGLLQGCAGDEDCAGDLDCVAGVCRARCLFTCLFSETGDICLDGHCVDCESSDDCPGHQYVCDRESHACIELEFSAEPLVYDCGTCPSGTLCGAGGDPQACGTPGFGPAWCTPGQSIPEGWSYLENGQVRIGVDLRRGAAIGHFSSLISDGNILDENDTGRYLQQSYYGDDRGGSWNGEPWNFNPVQGGDSSNVPSEVVDFCNNGRTLYAKTIPRDWGGLGVTPTLMEEWISLSEDLAVIHFRFTYQGDWNNGVHQQEVPAFFVRRKYENLTFYQGSAPWSGGALTRILPNQLETQGNQYINFNEPWLAYMDANGLGVGLYKRGEDAATCYRFANIGDTSGTSYFAMLDEFALLPGLVHDYTIYMKIGDSAALRASFARLFQGGL